MQYVTAHNFDADEAPSLRCLKILRMHLRKARSDFAIPKAHSDHERLKAGIDDALHKTGIDHALQKTGIDQAFHNARSDPTGVVIEASDLPKDTRKKYREKQSDLVNLGVAGIALMCVSTHAANIEGNLADEGLELLLEILNDGNQVVQVSCAMRCQRVTLREGILSVISSNPTAITAYESYHSLNSHQ